MSKRRPPREPRAPQKCARCNEPARGGTIGYGCLAGLRHDLRLIAFLDEQLQIVLTRLVAYGGNAGAGRSAEQPLPVDLRATPTALELRRALDAAVVAAGRPIHPSGPTCRTCDHQSCSLIRGPGTSSTSTAAWLLVNVDAIRTHIDAAALVDRIQESVAHALTIVDAPPDRARFLVGRCPEKKCQGDVRASIPAEADTARAAKLTCTANDTHTWDSWQWNRLGRRMLPPKALIPIRRVTLRTVEVGPCAGCKGLHFVHRHGAPQRYIDELLLEHLLECPGLAAMLAEREAS
jgi:hypothetical protein